MMVLIFLVQTIIALAQTAPTKGLMSWITSLDFWSFMSAGETAAWRLKWIMIPLAIAVLWSTRKVYRSILEAPDRYCMIRYAKAGFLACAVVPLLTALLIGVTVPERLRQRQLAIAAGQYEAEHYALGYTFERAFLQYQELFEKLPDELEDLKQVPDPDGSIAAALRSLDPKVYPTAYKPSADVAAALPKRNSPVRGSAIKASLSAANDVVIAEGLSFTNYELRLPGPDKLLNTEDDLLLRDGVITKASDSPKPITTTASTKASTLKTR
jgi:hypothetical protein